ncbi:MAG: alpha/beta fold hydrolase [Desulfovibrio sp.]|nr:MAG: alpha/beta fold hydrolase [Desulfovibrio sp.]
MNVVFLHGLAGESRDFSEVAALLKGWRVITPAIDYFSGKFVSLPELAGQVAEELPQDLDTAQSLVVGNSLGGMLALALAGRFGRVLLAGAHIRTQSGFVGRGRKMLHTELGRIFHDPSLLTPEQVARYEERWKQFASSRELVRRLKPLKRMLGEFCGSRLYQEHQDRIHLVCGESDSISPVEVCRELQAAYPAMELTVLERCGHAVPLEQPKALADVLNKEWRALAKKCLPLEPSSAKFFSSMVTETV